MRRLHSLTASFFVSNSESSLWRFSADCLRRLVNKFSEEERSSCFADSVGNLDLSSLRELLSLKASNLVKSRMRLGWDWGETGVRLGWVRQTASKGSTCRTAVQIKVKIAKCSMLCFDPKQQLERFGTILCLFLWTVLTRSAFLLSATMHY